jgi:hypothetical protein
MEDRSISTPAGEMPMPREDLAGAAGPAGPLGDPRALTILTTEHWSLLSARSLVYNEAFARAGMFLAFLSATLVALGLVTTATGFSDGFLIVAAAVLALDLFIGLASLGRIAGASGEDMRYLQGMNRIRHAYHEMVPGLAPYFITSHHDDIRSVLSLYTAESGRGRFGDLAHALTTTPLMIHVICSAVGGALVAVIAMLVWHSAIAAGSGALLAFALLFATIAVRLRRHFLRFWGSLDARFPSDEDAQT